MSKITRSCRDVTALVLAEADRTLSVRERLAIRVHMVICKACPRFERQVRLLNKKVLPRWRRYREEGPPG
jgi:Putative zinc-finger